MKKAVLSCLLTIFTISGIMLINNNIPAKADLSATLSTNYGAVLVENILYQEDFEDGDLATADRQLIKGMTWTKHGDLATEANKSLNSRILRLNAGAYTLSNESVNESEYTVSFTSINWYNTPARVMIEYQDSSNYYSFCPTTGQVYRMLNGIEKELKVENVSRILSSPRQNPSINYYKIYFKNNGKSIRISVDRDGYDNGKDFEYTYIDKKSEALKRFKGGRIKLTRVDEGKSRYWVNFDNILVTKGKLQATVPRDPAKLYVSNSGDDSYEGTETKPFRTISRALECSYPGDEIIVEDGVYDEQIKFKSNRLYSEEDQRLILRSRKKHKATISSINFKYGDYVIMDGFKLRGGTIDLGGATGVEVTNNYIRDAGIGIKAAGVNCRVVDNYIYKCSFGINVSGSDMLVENNEIERLIFRKGDADYFRFFGEGHIIRGNYMHGTRHEEIGKAHVDGFQTYDNNGEYARHIVIEGNFIEDFYHQGFMGSGRYYYHSHDITFRNNVFKDATSWGMCISTLKDVKVYNNLFINMGIHGVGFRGEDKKPATGEVRNNIFYNANNCYFGLDNKKYASNNIVYRSDAYKKYDQESFPKDIVNVDPLFIDFDKNDFALHPNSPPIDKGMSLSFHYDYAGSARPYGSGFDIGPYEYQGSSLPVAYIKFYNCVSDNSGYEPFKVAFDASNSYAPEGRSIVSYEWDYDDGSSDFGVTTYHTFLAGKHTVKLTITDSDGDKHTASQEVDVIPAKYPNLYLHLPFNKDCLDVSGKNSTIEASKDILLKKSIYGKSIRFNNSKSRGISIKHNNYLDGIDEITIAFFAKKDAKDTAATVIHKHTVYGVQITTNGFAGSISTTSKTGKYSVAKVVNDTDWHHYAITYDGSNIITYLDGYECSRTELTGMIKRDASRDIVIGRNPWGASFEGLMDDIRIYDRALSNEEIGQLISGSAKSKSVKAEVSAVISTETIGTEKSEKTYYIRADAKGANDGRDWTNAWNRLPDVLERGATYYLASGSYPRYLFDDPESGAAYIIIKKATHDDHGTGIGWQDSYASGVACFTDSQGPIFKFTSGYYIIDGQTGQGDSGHGIKLYNPANIEAFRGGNCMMIPNNAQVRYLTLRHVEMEDTGWAGSTKDLPYKTRTIYAVGTTAHITFQYCFVHDSGQEWMLFAGTLESDYLVEHCYFKNGGSGSSDYHSVGVWFRGDKKKLNIHLWYNTFENFASTGGTGYISIGWRGDATPTYSSGYYIYGNVFKETSSLAGPSRVIGSNGANGGPFISDIKILNNTFYKMRGKLSSRITLANKGTDNLVANNLWYDCDSSPRFVNIEEKNNIINDMVYDPFIDAKKGNFHLSHKLPGGMKLNDPFNKDMDGAVRGMDKVWDIGAYEYIQDNGQSPTP